MSDSQNVPDIVSVTVELPTIAAQRIAAAVCFKHGYAPVSEADAIEFVKQRVFEYLREITLEHEAGLAIAAARDSVYANPDDPLSYASSIIG